MNWDDTIEECAYKHHVSERSLRRWLKYEQQCGEPKRLPQRIDSQRLKTPSAYNIRDLCVLKDIVEKNNTYTVPQLTNSLIINTRKIFNIWTVSRMLGKLGYSNKIITKVWIHIHS